VLWHLVSDSSESVVVLKLSFDMATVHCVAIYTGVGMTICNYFLENVHSLVPKFCELYNMTVELRFNSGAAIQLLLQWRGYGLDN
jgi:hypothetical protein